jgi:hypothetical protein
LGTRQSRLDHQQFRILREPRFSELEATTLESGNRYGLKIGHATSDGGRKMEIRVVVNGTAASTAVPGIGAIAALGGVGLLNDNPRFHHVVESGDSYWRDRCNRRRGDGELRGMVGNAPEVIPRAADVATR